MRTKEELLQVLAQFSLEEKVGSVEPFGNGHINDTYIVVTTGGEKKYILQKINHAIFTDVELLQNNILNATNHIRAKLVAAGENDIDRKVLTFLPAKDGKYFFFDGEFYWRVCLFIADSVTYEAITPDLAFETGKAFGNFHKMLADIPKGQIGESIPNFHNIDLRQRQLADAVNADPVGRKAEVADLLNELAVRKDAMRIQEVLLEEGKLSKRITHCDTKVNNILFDKEGNVLCVIDLDTVMPGFVLSDIGDFIRTAVNMGLEDDENLDNIQVNMPIFEAFIKGYMEEAKNFLTPLEIKMLPYGGRMLTYMQTVRFLTDYIAGDTYYKIHSPLHNLQRTKAQFKFLQELEKNAEKMDGFMEQFL
ncbi:aminoglycoside phosphotransferase family protein [Bacteroidales bacterium OttesenSCG-928-A17]|nr:aminoglycoside phosphotransferase family protein [Bacteroidales bacterium OttesenSCG-928-A17]